MREPATQINAVENLSFVNGSHQLKFGVDYRRLSPITGLRKYLQFVQTNLTAAQSETQPLSKLKAISSELTSYLLTIFIRTRYVERLHGASH